MNRIFSLFLVFILLLISAPLPYALASDLISVSIVSPAAGEIVENSGCSLEAATKGNVDYVVFELDGKILDRDITRLTKDMLSIGKHTLAAHAIGFDGSVASAVSNFTVIKTVCNVRIDNDFENADFSSDNLSENAVTFGDGISHSGSINANRQLKYHSTTVSKAHGPDGKDDAAVYMTSTDVIESSNRPFFAFSYADAVETVLTFECDIKINEKSNVKMTFTGYNSSGESETYYIKDNKELFLFDKAQNIAGTSHQYESDKWYHLRAVLYAAESKIDLSVSHLGEDNQYIAQSILTGENVSYIPNGVSRVNLEYRSGPNAGITIDNVYVAETPVFTGINKTSYIYGSEENQDTNANSKLLTALKIYFNEPVVADKFYGCVKLVSDDGSIIYPNRLTLDSENNAIIATLPRNLSPSSSYDIKASLSLLFSGDTSVTDVALWHFITDAPFFGVTDVIFTAGGYSLFDTDQLTSKKPGATLHFSNTLSKPRDITAIFSIKNENMLIDIDIKHDTIPADSSSYPISLETKSLGYDIENPNVELTVFENLSALKVLSSYKPTQKKYITENTSAECFNSVFEKDLDALNYVGDAIIFKDDVNSLLYGNQKYRYEDVSDAIPYIDDNGTFMLPADIFSKAFLTGISLNGSEVSIGDNVTATLDSPTMSVSGNPLIADSAPTLKNSIVYLPLRSIAQDILGFTYLYDRGMHIFDTEEFPYTNSPSTYETKEPIDTIYRFMQFENKTAEHIYKKMDMHLGGNVHPRILTDSKSIEEIKTNAKNNAIVSEALTKTLADADALLTAPTVKYELSGIRLLTPAREVMERLVTLSTAYLFTGGSAYADRAWLEIENCFSWKDWNTSQHYLDNSELLYGVSVAFDAFYNYFSNERKEIIMDKTWELSLSHTFDRYQNKNFSGSEWRTARSNWGFVCNGAVVSAILAFGREENEKYQLYYDYLLECALQAIEYPLMLYYPDGAWEEGLAYWEYAMRYLAGSTLLPLYHSTGETFDFLTPEGVKNACSMGLYLQNGSFAFNFSDNGSEGNRENESVYAMALLLGDDKLMQTWQNEMDMQNAKIGARTLLWYRPGEAASASSMPLDKYFRGVEAGSMKESWHDENSSCVFFKGGQNNTNGSHIDTGTFCFDSMGQRWSVDLGKDSYDIAGGYNGVAGYQLYAKRPAGHNCLVINPRADVKDEYYGGQYLNGRAEIKKMYSAESCAYSIVNLSDTYKYDTSSYMRGFYLGDNRRTLLVQDEMNLLEENSDIYWFMHTRASVEIDKDGKGATLTKGDKKMRVTMLTNAENATFSIKSVGGENFQRFPTDTVRVGQLSGGSFTNVNVLTLNCQGNDNVYITIKLTPMDENFDTYSNISYKPISQW